MVDHTFYELVSAASGGAVVEEPIAIEEPVTFVDLVADRPVAIEETASAIDGPVMFARDPFPS